jgi:hypothetical protein
MANSGISKVEDDVKRHPEDPIIRFLLSLSPWLISGSSRMDGVAWHCAMNAKDIRQGYSSCETRRYVFSIPCVRMVAS